MTRFLFLGWSTLKPWNKSSFCSLFKRKRLKIHWNSKQFVMKMHCKMKLWVVTWLKSWKEKNEEERKCFTHFPLVKRRYFPHLNINKYLLLIHIKILDNISYYISWIFIWTCLKLSLTLWSHSHLLQFHVMSMCVSAKHRKSRLYLFIYVYEYLSVYLQRVEMIVTRKKEWKKNRKLSCEINTSRGSS